MSLMKYGDKKCNYTFFFWRLWVNFIVVPLKIFFLSKHREMIYESGPVDIRYQIILTPNTIIIWFFYPKTSICSLKIYESRHVDTMFNRFWRNY
jgi:hypothetical protein